ncbi:MAG: adenine phosphoribosyltransferase [Campylobacteraceae bacterium]|jgi:adenine phosphoribosyltransferase|nr:adenine phosphoribosyltransferase [Campylobacteraceae bacterium]
MVTLNDKDKEYLFGKIRDVHDFPKSGIIFKDITTLLNDKEAFNFLINHLTKRYETLDFEFITGIESRGFIFAGALAAKLNRAFVPIRKPKKLPYTTISEKYSLEYGIDEIEIHIDAFSTAKQNPPKVLLIDDLIATGGTAVAAIKLLQKIHVECVEACFVMNLKFLKGDAEIVKTTPVYSVLEVF